MTTINEITMTVAGNLVADPEIKHTTTGRSVARFRIAQTAAVERNGAWEDGQTTFIRCVAYGPIADHLAASRIGKGTRLVVTGRYAQRDWQTDQGERRSTYELTVDDIGASIKYATVRIDRAPSRPQPAATNDTAGDPWKNDDMFTRQPEQPEF